MENASIPSTADGPPASRQIGREAVGSADGSHCDWQPGRPGKPPSPLPITHPSHPSLPPHGLEGKRGTDSRKKTLRGTATPAKKQFVPPAAANRDCELDGVP